MINFSFWGNTKAFWGKPDNDKCELPSKTMLWPLTMELELATFSAKVSSEILRLFLPYEGVCRNVVSYLP